MDIMGRLHPLLIHFPIALVIMAAVAEAIAATTGAERWRTVAIANVRAGAMFAVLAAAAGWGLSFAPGMETSSILEWHRWMGTIATAVALVAALATGDAARRASQSAWTFRIALFAAGILIAATGHLGGVLVWGANFLRL